MYRPRSGFPPRRAPTAHNMYENTPCTRMKQFPIRRLRFDHWWFVAVDRFMHTHAHLYTKYTRVPIENRVQVHTCPWEGVYVVVAVVVVEEVDG